MSNEPIQRRQFLSRTAKIALGAVGLVGAPLAYGFWEARQIRVTRASVTLPRLPQAFAGKTIAVLGDFHHGPFVSVSFIREAVRMTMDLRPDMIALVGDFAHKGSHTDVQLPGCIEALSTLQAPLGVYAVPGNHDMQRDGAVYRECIANSRLTDLTNRSTPVVVGSDRIWLAGVDDLWFGYPNQRAALAGIEEGSCVVMLSHNPDFIENEPDERVDLMLSGHTHGGQVCVPFGGPLWMPSRYGAKYQKGLVRGPKSQVYVTTGLGVSRAPVRIGAMPEINLLTLS